MEQAQPAYNEPSHFLFLRQHLRGKLKELCLLPLHLKVEGCTYLLVTGLPTRRTMGVHPFRGQEHEERGMYKYLHVDRRNCCEGVRTHLYSFAASTKRQRGWGGVSLTDPLASVKARSVQTQEKQISSTEGRQSRSKISHGSNCWIGFTKAFVHDAEAVSARQST